MSPSVAIGEDGRQHLFCLLSLTQENSCQNLNSTIVLILYIRLKIFQ